MRRDFVCSMEDIYRMRAARPAAAAIPAKAVWRAPPAEDDDVVAPAAADDAEEARDEALEAADEATEDALLFALDSTEEALPAADEALEEALASAPAAPKIVVDPTVVVKVDEPEVSTETIAEVVIAEEAPDPSAPAAP